MRLPSLAFLAGALALSSPALGAAAEPEAASSEGAAAPVREEGTPVKIKPKSRFSFPRQERGGGGLVAPETSVIDAPTAAVLDYGGYSARTRFYSQGGLLQYVSFGVYPRLNLGASLSINGLIGDERTVRARPPEVQVKYRFFDGDRSLPALMAGYDGQGFRYSRVERRYHERQRGFFLGATQELGAPGLQVHPSFNISDFDSNAIFGALPFSYLIRDKATVLFEWDNISNFYDSRINSGLRVHLTPNFSFDFSVRDIGKGGWFADGDPRGPERVVQLKYSGNF
ncbi:MAG: hypothetical protein PHF00_00845 [Elusimicrobia bacterium]|nr:hypothetical protein [Elusimicrobiota bacterium]